MFLLIIAFMFLSIISVKAETVWYDNFDDNEADGWEMDKLDFDADPIFVGTTEFDTSAGTLKVSGGQTWDWLLATHDSHVDIGTWMFDINIVDTPGEHFYIFLMSDDWATYPTKAFSYDLVISTYVGFPNTDSRGAISLFKRNGWRAQQVDLGPIWSSTEKIVGWHKIIITRDPDGVFDVYLNPEGLDAEPIIHVEDKDPVFGLYSTFRFEANPGPEIDNVVVLDTYDFESAIAWTEPKEPVFEMSNLAVDPDSVKEGETVTVSVECSNVGTGAGSHTVVLMVNGENEDEETVSLDPGDSTTISFDAPTSEVGTLSVEIEGLTGSYEVIKAQTGIPGFPIESLISGLVVAFLILWFRQRAS